MSSEEGLESLWRKSLATHVATVGAQSNAAPKVSTNKRTQGPQAFWEDDGNEYGDNTGPYSNVRKKIRTSLTALVKKCHMGVELDYLINTTKGLVTSNNEIWNRVRANLKNFQNRQFDQLSEKPEMVFRRVGFGVVKALSRTYEYRKFPVPVEFSSQWIEQTKAFSVTCFPHSLRTVVIPSLDKVGMLNYSEYLKRSFILEESIMLPFLAILKDHLEEFQVFLGNVESWIMESAQNVIFLQKTFNVNHDCSKAEIGENYTFIETKHPTNDKSHYNLSFDVSNNNGRKKLTTFLAFLYTS